MGPPCDPKNGARNLTFFPGGTGHFVEACDVFVRAAGLGNARSPGSWLREGQCPGGTKPVIPSCGLIRLWPRMYQRCFWQNSQRRWRPKLP